MDGEFADMNQKQAMCELREKEWKNRGPAMELDQMEMRSES